MPDQSIAALCTPETFIRNTMVSDTFRANIVLDGTMTTVDIERIQVPFTKPRETMLREKYHMTDQDLKEFYSRFSHGLRNGLMLATQLHKNKEFEESNGKSLVSYVFQKTIKTDNGYEVYLMSRPMTRYLESDFCPEGKMTFMTLVSLGIRLAFVIYKFNELGINIGALDMDSVCIVKAPPDPQKKGQDYIIKITSLLYARSKNDTVKFPYQAALPFSAHPSLLQEGQPDATTDFYSLAAVLATLANGTYGTDNPSLDLSHPPEFPELFYDALNGALKGTIPPKMFIKMLRDVKSSLKKTPGASDNALEVSFCTEQANYLDIEPEQEEPEYAPEEEDQSSPEPEPELLDMDFDVESEDIDKSFILPTDIRG